MEWMRPIRLPISAAEFHQLPRNPAYRYEYIEGAAYLTPRPRYYHALLDLQPLAADARIDLEPVLPGELLELDRLFIAAFRHTPPYDGLDDKVRLAAGRQALEQVEAGVHGPWIQQASFRATEGDALLGAILVTLLPRTDPCAWDSYHWEQPPPADCIDKRLGRPHLTWVFVDPGNAGRGIGTTLLAAAVQRLLAMGYTELLSTFLLGNNASLLWHWRNGFRLLVRPDSYRAVKERWKQR